MIFKRIHYRIKNINLIKKKNIKNIILKKTMDMIFYHINLLIIKIRGTHILMDHHSK